MYKEEPVADTLPACIYGLIIFPCGLLTLFTCFYHHPSTSHDGRVLFSVCSPGVDTPTHWSPASGPRSFLGVPQSMVQCPFLGRGEEGYLLTAPRPRGIPLPPARMVYTPSPPAHTRTKRLCGGRGMLLAFRQ